MNNKIVEKFLNTANEIGKFMHQKFVVLSCDKVVTGLQFHAIKYIEKHPKTSVGELAEALMMSSGAIAQLIERLEEKKLVNREIDLKDKRIVHLALTKLGEIEVLEMKRMFMKKMSSMLSLISEDDLKEIVRIQEKLLENLKKQTY